MNKGLITPWTGDEKKMPTFYSSYQPARKTNAGLSQLDQVAEHLDPDFYLEAIPICPTCLSDHWTTA